MLPAVLLCAAVVSVAQDTAHVVVATADVDGRATAWNYPAITPDPGGLNRAARLVDRERSNPAHAEQPVLRIVSFNDLDGTLQTDDGRAVAARLKSSLDASRAECGCATLAVAAGGQLSGTLVADVDYGRSVIDVMNLFDLDAATLGTNDLAWPRDTLRRRAAEATFPWVVTNVFDRTAGARPLWMRSSIVTEVAGRRVAIIGYLSPAIAARSHSARVGRRLPAHSAYATASSQVTPTIGSSPQVSSYVVSSQ